MADTDRDTQADRGTLEAALVELRPDLHRYLARMTGSVFDGEDLVQETLIAATEALDRGTEVRNLRAWLFRIAHNKALNAFRAQKSEAAMKGELLHRSDPYGHLPQSGGAADALVPFMGLTPKQRSVVILRDVLGYDTGEVVALTGMSTDATKSALKRGRLALRDGAAHEPRPLSSGDKARLEDYARHFNAHDFDRIRDMLADEVRLNLVARQVLDGAPAVGQYFSNYARQSDWLMVPGQVEDRPAILVFDPNAPDGPPVYFVGLRYAGDEILHIQDFRYARYAMRDAVWSRLT